MENPKLEELIRAAKQCREAAAACFRVIYATDDPTIVDRMETEFDRIGVENGFGKRLQDAIAEVEKELTHVDGGV